MGYETILYTKKDKVGLITLNRPDKLNAISIKMTDELIQVLNEAERDENVRAVILTGGPRADGRPCFSAGVDLKEIAQGGIHLPESGSMDIPGRIEGMLREDGLKIWKICNMIERLSKITIAAIDGVCTAGGLELALACDLRLVSETAQISDMHVKNLGAIGGGAATVRLARLVGAAKAKELVLLGEPVNGAEAVSIGFANRVYPPAGLLGAAHEMAGKIANMSPIATRMAKASINATLDMNTDQALRFSYLCFVACAEAAVEGAKAFSQKKG